MSDDIPDLAALRALRMESDAEYIEQLEGLTIGMAHAQARLEAEVEDEAETIRQLVAERDRLRVVADAAREFAAAWLAWHNKIEIGGHLSSTDDESRRRAASIADLLAAVRRLDDGR